MDQTREHVQKMLEDMMQRVNAYAVSCGGESAEMPAENLVQHVDYVIANNIPAEDYIKSIESQLTQAMKEVAAAVGVTPAKKH